jgi:hypothetical protein
VTPRQPRNIVASVHQRLLNHARQSNRPFNEVLQYFAIERFLYRLSVSRHAGTFVLKGALMLPIWSAPLSRPTMDIDLLGRTSNDVDGVVEIVRDVCGTGVDPDGLTFDASSIVGERIAEQAEYEGVRVRFRATLGNARIAMQTDVGFGDVIVPSAERVSYPTILGPPAPQLHGCSKENLVAEKFQAMVRFGELNSRMKDFYDVWAVSQRLDFDGTRLSDAIEATFANRGTDIPADPEPLRPAFAEGAMGYRQWRGFLRRHRLEAVQAPLARVIADLALFLAPAARELAAGRAFNATWHAPGPWSAFTS